MFQSIPAWFNIPHVAAQSHLRHSEVRLRHSAVHRTLGRLGAPTYWVAVDKHPTVGDARAVGQGAKAIEDIAVPLPLQGG